MPRRPALRTMATWLLQAVAFAAGGFLLQALWQLFNEFAFNGSRGDKSWSWVTMFWYALPGFEAGLLVGLLPFAVSRGMRLHVLSVLNRAVWAENVVNVALIWFLTSPGGLF